MGREDLLSVKAVAAEIGASPAEAWRLIHRDNLPLVGGPAAWETFVRRQDIAAYLDGQEA